ncbi:MAG: amino acid permease [Bacillariaceae sp.]|jgi:amino acid permease
MTDVIQSSGGGGDNNTAGNDSNDDVDVVVMTTNDNDNVNNNNDDNNDSDDDDDDIRIGSISSARFNILSTMVGGGCLSLPMAFQQSGNALCGPIMLLITGFITDFCFRSLVATAIHIQKPHSTRSGKDTFESITQTAFGQSGYIFSMGLVVLMCFFGTVGYSVLLRDMMVPLNDVIAPHLFHGHGILSNWFHRNFTMFLVILIVTPFCTLRRLTALKNCGALSMGSLLILGSCIVFRSVQCNLNCSKGDDTEENEPWYTYLKLFPDSWHDLLNAVPLYISCFVCHYNILPVHNELMDPSPARVSWWLRSTTWFAVLLYMIMGFAGSSYAHCTPTGKVQGSKLVILYYGYYIEYQL